MLTQWYVGILFADHIKTYLSNIYIYIYIHRQGREEGGRERDRQIERPTEISAVLEMSFAVPAGVFRQTSGTGSTGSCLLACLLAAGQDPASWTHA